LNIAVIVAHPDDEIIGVGGTLIKHVKAGDNVSILIVSEGRSSRLVKYEDFDKNIIDEYICETKKAIEIIGVRIFKVLKLPNNRLDRLDLIDIIKTIQIELDEIEPHIIYTHFYDDLNIDHRLISQAVVTATRALPGSQIREILMFETLSSTEQASAIGKCFSPNLFVDITEFLHQKLLAMKCYESELHNPPHPRSIEIIEKNAQVWGAKCGVDAAEAFVVARIIR
jgi:LmbE family N-acetylglucosaminyl deacetylase